MRRPVAAVVVLLALAAWVAPAGASPPPRKQFEDRRCERVEGGRLVCTSTHFGRARIANRSFRDADLRDSGFVGAVLRNVDFSGARLAGAAFSHARIVGSDFTGVNPGRGRNEHMRFQRVVIRDSTMRGDFSGASFTAASLRGVDFAGANLAGAKFTGADLRGANLSGANLVGAELRAARLQGADLSGANLTHAGFVAASLQGADLSGARLVRTSFERASLRDADLRGAVIRFADLTLADLVGARLGVYADPAPEAGSVARIRTVTRTCGTRFEEPRRVRGVNRPGTHPRTPGVGAQRQRWLRANGRKAADGPVSGMGGHIANTVNDDCAAPRTRVAAAGSAWTAAAAERAQLGPSARNGCRPGPYPDCHEFDLDGTSWGPMDVRFGDFWMTQFMDTTLTRMDFSGSFIGDANFTGATLNSVTFANVTPGIQWATPSGTLFDLATSTGQTTITGNLNFAQFSGANLQGVDFSGSDLRNANFDAANVSNSDFTGANLEGAQFDGAVATGAKFTNADLTNTNFDSAYLESVDFTGATMHWTQLSGARLPDTSLGGAGIWSASWYYADLTETDLSLYGVPTSQLGPDWAYASERLPLVLDISGYTCLTGVARGTPFAQPQDSMFPSSAVYDSDDCNLAAGIAFDLIRAVASVATAIVAPEATALSIGLAVGRQIASLGVGAVPETFWSKLFTVIFS